MIGMPSRREVIVGAGAILGASSTRVLSSAPAAVGITPSLIEAARREGKVNWYTAMDLVVAETWAKVFEAKHPGVSVRVERSGSERLFQRIGQEMKVGVRNVDIVNTADAAHILPWKRNGWLAAFVPEEVAAHYSAAHRDPDGYAVTVRLYLSVIGVTPARSTASLRSPSVSDSTATTPWIRRMRIRHASPARSAH